MKPVLIDCDDVLLNLLDHWLEYLNKKYKLNYYSNDIKSWNISEWISELTKKEIYDCLYQQDFYEDISPVIGSYGFISMLKANKIPFRVVTAHNYKTISAKVEQIFRIYGNLITWDDIIIASDKSLISGSVMIDDNISNLIDNKLVDTKILFSRPHNLIYKNISKSIYYTDNFKEIYNIIKG